MKLKRLFAIFAASFGVTIAVCVALISYWQNRQPVFRNGAKLVSAMQAFSRDLTARGQPLPPTVSLHELVSGGYLVASEVRAFERMDVSISLTARENQPQEMLIRVRMWDGSVTALLADGSVQGLRN